MEKQETITITRSQDYENFTDLRFVLKALPKAKSSNWQYRERYATLHVDENCIFCTDGERLHSIQNDLDFPLGSYTIIKNTTSEIILSPANDVTMPNRKSVINKNAEYGNSVPVVEGKNIGHFLYYLYKLTDQPINPNYIADLGDCSYQISKQNGEDKGIQFRSSTRFAIIMPLIKEKSK